MSAHLARAQLLLAQSRPADAEREIMLALASAPEDPSALALLALSRSDQKKGPAALAAAESAVGLAPDDAYIHYIHALTLHRLDRDNDARAAIREALRLDPEDGANLSLLASIELARGDWTAALAAAEQALALDPENVSAANLRSMALVRLGRKEEAMATVDSALQRAPDNGFSHANQGWNCLHRNDPRQAQIHFREALRLQPDLEYARQGMLEALKARNPIYRAMLAYFLWMGRLGSRLQWAFIIGIWFGGRFVRSTVAVHPQLGWVLWPVLILLYVFIYLSWTAQPMFNLLLRFSRFGRHVLSRDQRIASNWFGAVLGSTLGCLAWWQLRNSGAGLLAGVLLGLLSICVAATFNREGRNRWILAAASAALAAVGAAILFYAGRGSEAAYGLMSIFIYGFVGFQLLANFLRR